MNLSKHASLRLAQRGFQDQVTSMIFHYGSSEHAPGGAVRISMRKKDIAELISENIYPKQLFDKIKKRVLILSNNGRTIITLY